MTREWRKTTISTKAVVYIGNRPPTMHYAQASKEFIPKAELYQPKNRDQKR